MTQVRALTFTAGSLGRRTRRSPSRTHPALYLFPLPAVVLLVVFFLIPLLQAAQYAVTDWNGYSDTFAYVGLSNFEHALTNDILFSNSLFNNLKFMVVVVVAELILSLLLAILLVRNSRSSIVLRAIFFFPAILSSVSVAFIWKFVYDPTYGIGNFLLGLLGLDSLKSSYLGDDQTAIYWVAAIQVWFFTGMMIVIFIAGLQGIPKELYEAADMDGASPWRQFTSITWPLIAPATTIVVAYTTIQTFKAFDLILGLSGNPPRQSTDILSTRVYTSFANSQFGYAAAESLLFMAIIGIVIYLQHRVLKLTQKTE